MKKLTIIPLAICIIALLFTACSKSKTVKPAVGALGRDFPTVLNNIITPAIIDTLKAHGTTINSGLTPPTVNGAFLFHPDYCTYDNSGDESSGSIYDDYKYQFASQNTGNFTLSVQYEDTEAEDTGSDGSATYISGSGNLFTVYAETNGSTDGINYVSLQIISGEVQSGGLKNLQISTYLKSKVGDTDNSDLEPVRSTRIFQDQDGTSESTTFSVSKIIQSLAGNNGHAKSHFSKVISKN